jgi:D-3-phosphoglycerate dehydrogenase
MIKILITDKLAQEGIDLLKGIEGVEPAVKVGIGADELARIIGDYDGLIVRSGTKVTAQVLANSGKLRGIARAGVGVDNIDVVEATKKGILVMNTPGGNTLSAAEHTMALILSLSRNVVPACNSLKGGVWDRKKYMGNQLNNKVLGVIGLGRIGMSVVKMAVGFNMKVLGYDPFAAPQDAEAFGIEIVDDLERIYKEADYISVHVPKNEQTLNMISAKELKMMKPTARIVNCARGGIINEDDLYDALEAGTIAGAALDVYPKEPPENTRFTDIASCLVTPHLGASTEEAQIEVAVEAAQILANALKGGPIRNALNAPSVSASVPAIVNHYAELARRIGTIMSTIAAGRVRSVQVEYRGAISEKPVDMITTAFSIGLLRPYFNALVNMVNVRVLAKERGISIAETKTADVKSVASSFSATVETDRITRTIRGTVFGENLPRVIEIDGFNIEVAPKGTLLIIFNDDKPGVIGAVGTVCGKHAINIGTMGVGQKVKKGKQLLAVSLDKRPSEEVIKELGALEFVNEIYVCKLD